MYHHLLMAGHHFLMCIRRGVVHCFMRHNGLLMLIHIGHLWSYTLDGGRSSSRLHLMRGSLCIINTLMNIDVFAFQQRFYFPYRNAAFNPALNLFNALNVLIVELTMSAFGTRGFQQAVATLPCPQRSSGDPAESGEFADGVSHACVRKGGIISIYYEYFPAG